MQVSDKRHSRWCDHTVLQLLLCPRTAGHRLWRRRAQLQCSRVSNAGASCSTISNVYFVSRSLALDQVDQGAAEGWRAAPSALGQRVVDQPACNMHLQLQRHGVHRHGCLQGCRHR